MGTESRHDQRVRHCMNAGWASLQVLEEMYVRLCYWFPDLEAYDSDDSSVGYQGIGNLT